jgi:hypothetical protein
VGEYWTSLSYKDQFDSSMHFVRGVPVYNQDYHRQQLCDWLDRAGEKVTAFDFTTKGILQEAVKGQYWRLRDPDGKASGLLGWWPSRSVTFIDNHDTGSKQQHWPFPEEKVLQGYAYILTHPGTPCVFWEHAFDWNLYNPIKKLIEARKTCGIHANSRLEILKAEEGLYVAKVDNRLLVKLGWQEYTPTQGAIKLTSGDQFCVWQLSVQKTDATQPVEENMEERDYFPGYGAADPNYNYRLGRELDSELLKAEWVIHRKTIFENQDYELNISTDILDQLFESHPDTKVRRRFPFQLKLTWITAADVAVHTKKKLFFRKQLKMGEFKRWFELLRKKKSWLPTGEWEKCGKTYRFFQEPVTESVATEFRVLDN